MPVRPVRTRPDLLDALLGLFREARADRLEDGVRVARVALAEARDATLDSLSPALCAATLDAARLGGLDDPRRGLSPPLLERLRVVRARLAVRALRRRGAASCVVPTARGWVGVTADTTGPLTPQDAGICVVLDHGRQRLDGAARALQAAIGRRRGPRRELVFLRVRLGPRSQTLSTSWALAASVLASRLTIACECPGDRLGAVGVDESALATSPPPDVRRVLLAPRTPIPDSLRDWHALPAGVDGSSGTMLVRPSERCRPAVSAKLLRSLVAEGALDSALTLQRVVLLR